MGKNFYNQMFFIKNISLEMDQKCLNNFCTNLAITIKFRVEFNSVGSLIQNMYVVGKNYSK